MIDHYWEVSEMSLQELIATARALVANEKACLRWMKVIQPATNDLAG